MITSILSSLLWGVFGRGNCKSTGMETVHLAIYPIRDLACPSPYKGGYPAALPSPTLTWGHGKRNGGFKIPQKGS